MRRFSIFFVLCLILPLSFANALIYEDLQPGVSTKSDADIKLGPPAKEIVPGILYSYSVENKDLKTLRVKFNNKGIIESIQMKFLEPYLESQLIKWFDLGKANKYDHDVLGNRIAVFKTKGVLLYFDGPDESAGVVGMSHFEPDVNKKKPLKKSENAPQINMSKNIQAQQQDKLKNYLGMLCSFKTENPTVLNTFHDSPAQKAGIQMGDILLNFNDRDLKNINKTNFVTVVRKLSAETPVKIKIKRNTEFKNFYVQINYPAASSGVLE